MTHDPFRNYDQWLTTTPYDNMPNGNCPMICTECKEHVFGDIEDLEGTTHCFDEDTGKGVGTLQFDDGWVFDASDDPQFPY